ncbi:MAG: hypothetical protein ABTQ34_02055 [Bdellovibrionales bacterium]
MRAALSLAKPNQTRKYAHGSALLALLAIAWSFPAGATASEQNGKEEFDPFSRLSQKDWVTPDKFEKSPPHLPDKESQTAAPSLPSPQPPETIDKQSSSDPAFQQPSEPNRSSEQFGLEVSSTAENIKLPIPLPPANANGPVKRYEPGWIEPAAMARRQAFIESGKGWSPYRATQQPSLRLSYLPGRIPALLQPENKAPANSASENTSQTGKNAKSAAAQTPATTKTDPQSPDLESWTKAIKDYKAKQMEAIQSDRQTLEALQNAIKDLGLQKELNFDSSLLLSPVKQETPPQNAKDGAKSTQ